MTNLEGDWHVERLGGLLPPMIGVWKRIRGNRGQTRIGPLWPGVPFRLTQRREGHVSLVYRPPLCRLVDELRVETDGSSWLGRTMLGGRELGRFRMTRIERAT
jgi:hypothetical protein